MTQPIYLDYNATTPLDPLVAAAMLPWLETAFGNPSSSHVFGQHARNAVAAARAEVAALIAASAPEIVFTGNATEANNLALLGVASALPDKRHLLISAVEHPAVMQPARHLREQGWALDIVPVDASGRVSPDDIARALRPDTALVSVMHANNEVGTIQPIADIAALAHANGSLMHTDAAQSAGKIALDVDALGADLLTLAGHKFYAPKGIGALYVRHGTPIKALLFGADQEHGLRPGTENVMHIVGLGTAAGLARQRLAQTAQHLAARRDQLHGRLQAAIPGLQLNGHARHRLPNTLHVSFPDVAGRDLLAQVSTLIAASLGSACHADHDAVSGVLAAMGCDARRAMGAVRLSVGLMTSTDDIDKAAAALIDAWQLLHRNTPTTG